MIEYNIADIVVLTDSYMKEWAPDERLIAAADGSRPQCDIGIIIGKNIFYAVTNVTKLRFKDFLSLIILIY